MGVQKFRSVAEMNAAPVLTGSAEGFDRFLRHCARYWSVAPRTYPQGVFKFQSLEAAQRARRRVQVGLAVDQDPRLGPPA